jgi:transmembrane sensor
MDAMSQPSDEVILRVLRGAASAVEDRAVRLWRQESPENEIRYRELAAVLALTKQHEAALPRPRVPEVAELIRRADDLVPTRRGWARALVASVVVAAGLVVAIAAFERRPPAFLPEVITGPAETTTVTFPDGSVVRLAPNSRLRPMLGASRDVSFEGRGFFAIAKAKGAPFRVRMQGGDIVVLGTRFEARADRHSAQVVVLEGRVALGDGVQRVEVAKGEMSRIVEGTTTRPTKVIDPRQVISWAGRMLVFQETRLADAVHEIEQQYGKSVTIEDPMLADQTITGWYVDKSFEDVMHIVCSVLVRECVVGTDRAVIGSRNLSPR